jgi:hypothetical protein
MSLKDNNRPLGQKDRAMTTRQEIDGLICRWDGSDAAMRDAQRYALVSDILGVMHLTGAEPVRQRPTEHDASAAGCPATLNVDLRRDTRPPDPPRGKPEYA